MHSAEAGPSLELHVRQCPKRPPDSLGGDCSASAESLHIECTRRAKTGKTAPKMPRPLGLSRHFAFPLKTCVVVKVGGFINVFLICLLCSIRFPYWAGGVSRSLYRARKVPASYSKLMHSGTGLIPTFTLRENLSRFFAWENPPQHLGEISEANPPKSCKFCGKLGP